MNSGSDDLIILALLGLGVFLGLLIFAIVALSVKRDRRK